MVKKKADERLMNIKNSLKANEYLLRNHEELRESIEFQNIELNKELNELTGEVDE